MTFFFICFADVNWQSKSAYEAQDYRKAEMQSLKSTFKRLLRESTILKATMDCSLHFEMVLVTLHYSILVLLTWNNNFQFSRVENYGQQNMKIVYKLNLIDLLTQFSCLSYVFAAGKIHVLTEYLFDLP